MPNIKFMIEFELIERDDNHWSVIAAGKRFSIEKRASDGKEIFKVFVHSGYSIPLGQSDTFDDAFVILKRSITAGDRFTSGVE